MWSGHCAVSVVLRNSVDIFSHTVVALGLRPTIPPDCPLVFKQLIMDCWWACVHVCCPHLYCFCVNAHCDPHHCWWPLMRASTKRIQQLPRQTYIWTPHNICNKTHTHAFDYRQAHALDRPSFSAVLQRLSDIEQVVACACVFVFVCMFVFIRMFFF